ncbi:MAG: four helix bundle protein [Bacteroidales bacterium]|nr:four helix bundle protein [Bacteroidales bacterium]
MATTFDELIIWQKARELTNSIYELMDGFRDWGFRDQLQRASVSIMNNIAEGFDSGSNIKFCYFLNIAKGSCSEVRSMLFLCEDLHVCSEEKRIELQSLTRQINTGIVKMISHLKDPTQSHSHPETQSLSNPNKR